MGSKKTIGKGAVRQTRREQGPQDRWEDYEQQKGANIYWSRNQECKEEEKIEAQSRGGALGRGNGATGS